MHSISTFYITVHAFNESEIIDSETGHTADIWLVSSTMALAVYLIVIGKIWIHTRYISYLFVNGLVFLSFAWYYLYLWVGQYSHWIDINSTTEILHRSPLVWAVVIAVVSISHGIDRVLHRYNLIFYPKPADFL